MPPPLDVVRSKLLPAGVTGYVEPRRGEALAEERSLPEVRRRLPAVNWASQADEVHLRGEGVGTVRRVLMALLAGPRRGVDFVQLLVHPPAAGTGAVVD
jgi:hypothetical protein